MYKYVLVAPPVGAWIETENKAFTEDDIKVAPPVGAWIETITKLSQTKCVKSRAPCGRVNWNFDIEGEVVATVGSRPLWARELKHEIDLTVMSRA